MDKSEKELLIEILQELKALNQKMAYPPVSVPFVQTEQLDCGCPFDQLCMSTACPRAVIVTYETISFENS